MVNYWLTASLSNLIIDSSSLITIIVIVVYLHLVLYTWQIRYVVTLKKRIALISYSIKTTDSHHCSSQKALSIHVAFLWPIKCKKVSHANTSPWIIILIGIWIWGIVRLGGFIKLLLTFLTLFLSRYLWYGSTLFPAGGPVSWSGYASAMGAHLICKGGFLLITRNKCLNPGFSSRQHLINPLRFIQLPRWLDDLG